MHCLGHAKYYNKQTTLMHVLSKNHISNMAKKEQWKSYRSINSQGKVTFGYQEIEKLV